MKTLKIKTYNRVNVVNLLPIFDITYDKYYEDELYHLSIDVGWLKWGISLVLIDK